MHGVPAEQVTDLLGPLGPWAVPAFIAVFVIACVLCVPVVVLTVASGALFGLGWGFLYSWIAAQLGASAAFFISRHLAHGWVSRRLARRPRLAAIEEAVRVEGWKIVGLVRLAPGSPFFLLNYLFGLTRIRYRDYAWATAVSIIPGTLLFVYLGSIGQLAASGRLRSVWDWAQYGAGLAALALACLLVARRARQLLGQRIPERPPPSQPPLPPDPDPRS